MKKIFYLSSCDTCKRIMEQWEPEPAIELQDIKSVPLSEEQVDEMKALAGSYESLFSKRAQLYKQRGLKDENLEEKDFRALLLEHYTFLKRPVLVDEDRIFIGNSKKVIAEAQEHLDS